MLPLILLIVLLFYVFGWTLLGIVAALFLLWGLLMLFQAFMKWVDNPPDTDL